jgi:2-dehydropantoate 2-reductase
MHMSPAETIYVLGSGAIGFPLAAFLVRAGRRVVAVRTSRNDVSPGTVVVTVQGQDGSFSVPVETASLASLTGVDGLLAVTAKAHANEAIATRLREKGATGPVVILQNGVGVEKPFLEAGFSPVYRCVLYITSQATAPASFTVRPVTASPIGAVAGGEPGLEQVVRALDTAGFPFRAEANIQREIWKKAIINAVFNSICPLLEVDNGIFARDEAAANLAREVVAECVMLADRLGLGLSEGELMDQLMRISKGSTGQLISTLQDIRSGRPTEIAFLNLEIARVAASLQPRLQLPKTELLGKLIVARSRQRRPAELGAPL